MPHKRRKLSVRTELSKTKDDIPNAAKFQDTPRGFTRALKAQHFLNQKVQEKLRIKDSANKDDGPVGHLREELKIQPGEKFSDFSRRVEETMRDSILHSTRDTSNINVRKKKNREKRKLKKLAKHKEILEEFEAKDFDKLVDNVKFGEVAVAPPVLTAVPKIKGSTMKFVNANVTSKAIPPQKKNKGNESSEDENMRNFKTLNKKKRQSMAPATKRILDAEREKAIAMYRGMKAKKAAASEFTLF